MLEPEKRRCDLCKTELAGPYIAMSYPLDASDRALIEKQLGPPPKSPFEMMGLVVDNTPRAWRFDFCRGCVDGFIPMLAELKLQSIDAWLAERQRRTAAPVEAD